MSPSEFENEYGWCPDWGFDIIKSNHTPDEESELIKKSLDDLTEKLDELLKA